MPSVGPKTAQRMALQLLEGDRAAGSELSQVLQLAIDSVGRCKRCRILSELDLCDICASPRREDTILCVVESPSDVFAIEQSHEFKGRYYVLSGHLSPLDGIGPDDIGIPELVERVLESQIKEVILATSTTVEGEATAFYISEQLSRLNIIVSRIAHGVPLGGGLEYVDGGTIAKALSGRSNLL